MYHGSKTKTKKPSRTQKRWRTVKSKRSPPPPLFPTSDREVQLGCNDDEPTLKDVRMALESFNSRLLTHDARLDEMVAPKVPLPAAGDQQPRPAATAAQPRKQPVNTRNQWQPRPFSEVAQPGSKNV